MTRFASAALAATLLSTTALALPAFAQDKPDTTTLKPGAYAGFTGGYLMTPDTDRDGGAHLERDNGYSFAGQYGYRLPNNLRLEAELGYGSIDNDSYHANGGRTGVRGDTDQYSLTGAAYYDIATGTPLTPYAGAGAGLMHQRFDRPAATANGSTLPGNSDSSTDLTAFGEVGVGYKLASSLEIVPSYRYQWINDGANGLDDSTQHVARLGFRSWF
ncbi:porin family protein [Ferrovibrio terrae]|uniref:outer membrane protein n=1 Tax=Ferrovibrio terrae TaxID=2594003 RepID=UPI0031377C66